MNTEHFAPISLEQLVGEAELLTRFDRKYLLPANTAAALLRDLDPRTRVLEIDGERGFAYDSVYFDTCDHLSYRLTAQRRRRRFKLRTRSYLDTGGCFLEVKTKDGRGSTVKERIDYAPDDRASLTVEGREFAAGILSRHGHDASIVQHLSPAMVSRYRRTTLLLPCGSRATFDSELLWRGSDRRVSVDDLVIVESKSMGRASALDRALWRAGHRPSGISKFGTGTALLHPELPDNKWARVLGGPLSEARHRAALEPRTIQDPVAAQPSQHIHGRPDPESQNHRMSGRS